MNVLIHLTKCFSILIKKIDRFNIDTGTPPWFKSYVEKHGLFVKQENFQQT